MVASPASGEPARIGPNAIIRTVEALRERIGAPATDDVLRAAGLGRYGAELPTAMVPEADVSSLYRALHARLSETEARAAAVAAGNKTARYLLAHRIPRAAQTLLRLLPARFAAPVLLASITKHTWTFAGSATVRVAAGPPLRVVIAGCPICSGAVGTAPLCSFFAASFEGLFRVLVSSRASVAETSCQALGAKACVFEIRW